MKRQRFPVDCSLARLRCAVVALVLALASAGGCLIGREVCP